MIQFFRKIRQNLLSNGLTGQYLKYAVGEIILVVIGILIAIQINNWNEERKDRMIENQILDEMLISLKSDNSTFQRLEQRLMDKDSAIQKTLGFKEKGILPSGKVFGDLINVARQSIKFSYDLSPYEKLVALGINKMSDKPLLLAINKYYTQELPRSAKFIESIEKEYEPKRSETIREAVNRGVLKRFFIKRDGDERWSVMYNSNPNRLLEDEKFNQSLIDEFQYMSGSLNRIRSLTEKNEILIDLLEKKLSTK